MNFKKMTLAALGAAVGVAGLAATGTANVATAAEMQDMPLLVYRTGPYAPGGIPLAAGMNDYIRIINERDGGINGVKMNVIECDTGYKTDRGVECYDRIKSATSSVINPFSTGITYALIEKATADKIPILSMGYGRTSAADGRVFPYVFNFPATYWSQATAITKYIADQEGGYSGLKGKRFAYIYLDHPYGKEPISTFETMAKKYGYTFDKYPVAPASMTEQKSIWLQIRRTKPDYAIIWGWGAMNATAVKEAANIKFKMDHFIGNWWSGAEPDVIPAGAGGKGYKSANFHGVGSDYPIYKDVNKLYADGKGSWEKDKIGGVLYSRGMVNMALVVEAIRTAQGKFGKKPLTGEEVRWGLENLDITAATAKGLGMTGLMPHVKVSCANHEGSNPGVFIQQWDGKAWKTITDWIPADTSLVRPLIEQDAAQYAKENNITPRSC